MKLKLFKTLWGHTGNLDDAIAACQQHGFDGIEGQPPANAAQRREFHTKLDGAGLDYIAEICTGGGYVPDRNLSPYKHLESLRRQAEAALECQPLFLTVIAGCDAWSIGESVDFFATAMRSCYLLKTKQTSSVCTARLTNHPTLRMPFTII